MAPPFSLHFLPNPHNTPPTTLVNQESNGLTIKSQHGQRLWDLSQSHLTTLPHTPATLLLRIGNHPPGRDHGRTYCTVRVPAQQRKYLYKFWLGIGEWVVAPVPAPQHRAAPPALPNATEDAFYGRRLAPVSEGVFWGLDGLLGCGWQTDHARVCPGRHWDVCISVIPADAAGGSQDPLVGLWGGGEKRFTCVRVCEDAKVEALFQNLIGFERSTRWESLAHCLTEVVRPCGPVGEVGLGRRWSFEEVREGGTRMWQTGWFEGKECVALVSSLSAQVGLKARSAFLCD
ncbi:hypothetical protein P167DRAFT_603183 [Morchella conica CCBAS932]|uniref:Uncharacterized protein n=1 Tax=Morchella conica CCBAS932 TaxID=1392247 RepID=A0A3N4KYQ8_9PEZI|nr:hypothetical protein P167DRAFT_603183 [Morchella conica CCBAS932]